MFSMQFTAEQGPKMPSLFKAAYRFGFAPSTQPPDGEATLTDPGSGRGGGERGQHARSLAASARPFHQGENFAVARAVRKTRGCSPIALRLFVVIVSRRPGERQGSWRREAAAHQV